MKPLRCVVLISGRGSNLAAMIKARDSAELPLEIITVISDKPQAEGLKVAKAAGISSKCIQARDFTDRAHYDLELLRLIDSCQPDLIILAGFMRILGASLVAQLTNKIINLHPSLLPKYPGLDTYNRALAAGDLEYGASIHFVTAELDAGTVISQIRLPVQASDTAYTLAARLQPFEHKLMVATLRLFREHTVKSKSAMLVVDEKTYKNPFTLAAAGYLRAAGTD